jgi:tungstate transport system ATP-binding protein
MAALERVGLAALARCRTLEPEALFLDETTARLDPAATRPTEAAIREIGRSGTKIVTTTYDLGRARRLADEVLFMSCVVDAWSSARPRRPFLASPRSGEAAAFLDGRLP